MRSRIAAFLIVTVLALVVSLPSGALAAPVAGTSVQVSFASSNVGTSTWVPVVTSTARGIKGVVVYNSSLSPLQIGIATAGATANTEVAQTIVPGRLSGAGVSPVPLFYPMAVGYGARISIRALGSTATAGEMDMSLFYN